MHATPWQYCVVFPYKREDASFQGFVLSL